MKRGFGHFRGERALAKRDGALGKRPQALSLRQRGDQPLVNDQRSAKVAQQSKSML